MATPNPNPFVTQEAAKQCKPSNVINEVGYGIDPLQEAWLDCKYPFHKRPAASPLPTPEQLCAWVKEQPMPDGAWEKLDRAWMGRYKEYCGDVSSNRPPDSSRRR